MGDFTGKKRLHRNQVLVSGLLVGCLGAFCGLPGVHKKRTALFRDHSNSHLLYRESKPKLVGATAVIKEQSGERADGTQPADTSRLVSWLLFF